MIRQIQWIGSLLFLLNIAIAQQPDFPVDKGPTIEKTVVKEKKAPIPSVKEKNIQKQKNASQQSDGIEKFASEIDQFALEVAEYRQDVRRLIQAQYDRKRRDIQKRFQSVIDKLSEEERERRENAIKRFEEFVRKYPNKPRFTPDALFRLAELHFEKSNDSYITALEEYDELLIEFDNGNIKEEPAEPRQDYRISIDLFDRLVKNWPDYRNIDGAYYLKGYCLLEMAEEKLALNEFQSLVSKKPNSKFVPETWTRIGEYFFDHNKLPEAIVAYQRVVDEHPQSGYYDKALYKLAWTRYRNDEYTEAIQNFRDLIEYSDELAEKTGQAGSELRSEAIEYLAVSLQEEDWDSDGDPDQDSGFPRVLRYVKGEKNYDVEILRSLSDIFFDNAKYPETISTIRHLLKKFPGNKENPELHSKMITAYERMMDFDKAFSERSVLANAYGEKSIWRKQNKSQNTALLNADEMMEDALIQTATYHHSNGQRLRKEGGTEEEILNAYGEAANSYEKYLKRYPGSNNAYELNYLYAECLYYSFHFKEAADQYSKVRDSKLDDRYKEDSAFSVISSNEEQIKELIKTGQIPKKATLLDLALEVPEITEMSEDEYGKIKVIQAEKIPEEVQRLIDSRIYYYENKFSNQEYPDRSSNVLYKIGEVYLGFRNFDKAREWFWKVLNEYPNKEVSKFAGQNIIETRRQENNLKLFVEESTKISKIIKDKSFTEEAGTLVKIAIFKDAEALMAQSKFDQAAAGFMNLVERDPGHKYAPAALNNAAVAYEESRRFESATKLYERIYKEHPNSEFAEGALFRVGINSERFYDFDKAIKSHLELVREFKNSKHRSNSLSQAAILQEQTQKYKKSAENYELFAKNYPSNEDSASFYYQAGKNYRKLGDKQNEIRIYEGFINKYGRNPKQNRLVIESLARIAEIHQEAGRSRTALRAWQTVIDEFNRRAMSIGGYHAQFPARGTFEHIEVKFNEYKALKLRGSLTSQGRIIKEMQSYIKTLNQKYTQIFPFKSFDWTLAAFFRTGQLYQIFAQNLYEAPIPPDFSLEEEEMYRTQLEDIAMPIEDEAIKKYEFAYQKAIEFKINNKWTKNILFALNKYKPNEYPLFKEEKTLLFKEQWSPSQLLNTPTNPESEAILKESSSDPEAAGVDEEKEPTLQTPKESVASPPAASGGG